MKEIVEAAILLDDDDDVLDVRRAARAAAASAAAARGPRRQWKPLEALPPTPGKRPQRRERARARSAGTRFNALDRDGAAVALELNRDVRDAEVRCAHSSISRSTSAASLKRRSSSRTCAESACEPLPIDQTWRSCTPATPAILFDVLRPDRRRRRRPERFRAARRWRRARRGRRPTTMIAATNSESTGSIQRAMRQRDGDAPDDDRQRAERVAERRERARRAR